MADTLKYDMPGPAPFVGTGDSITVVAGDTRRLTKTGASFTSAMVGRQIIIHSATDPLHNGRFLITAVENSNQITYENGLASDENPFTGGWSVVMPESMTSLLAYDAAEVDDDELMLSGPHTGAGGSTPPGSWPNPGADDTWAGPYGPEMVDWTNATHPGADLTQGGWSPPNQSLKYDTSIPAGWYTRVSRKDRLSRVDREVPTINDP